MYITSESELREALAERREKRPLVRARAAEFLRETYGFPETMTILPPPLRDAEGPPVAVLARQIASVCGEDVAFEVAAEALGLRPMALTFFRDSFTKDNHDKLHRVEVPWSERSVRKGTPMVAYERLSARSNLELDGVPLHAIACANGKALTRVHREFRRAARLRAITYDVSHVHRDALARTTRRPSYVFRYGGNAAPEERHSLYEGDAVFPADRPPAEWYYPYYFSWFLDGTMVIFETYDNPIASVAGARDLFGESVRRIVDATGFTPLVVKIPPLSYEMLRCNRHLLWDARAMTTIREQASRLSRNDTVELMSSIANIVDHYH